MLGWIHEKMTTLESTPRGGKISISSSTATGNDISACNDLCAPSENSSTVVGNDISACNDLCAPSEDCSTAVRNGYWDNAHTSDPSNRGERLGEESSTLVQHAQHRVGAQVAKLAML